MTRFRTVALLVALLPLYAATQSTCDARAEAEQAQVTREFSARPPSKNDKDAYLAWSTKMHAALAAVAQRHEDCRRANRPAVTPATAATVDACLAENNRRVADSEKRYRGRSLSAQEQAALRAEGDRLMDERMACARGASR